MSDYKLTKKEAFGYWWKIIFLFAFAIFIAFGAVSVVVTPPFSVSVLIFSLGMGAGAVVCAWLAVQLVKEYFYWKNKGKELEHKENTEEKE
jgi:hypothetical protein